MFASSHSRRLGGQYGYEECEPDAFSRPPCELRLSFAETRFRSRPKKIKETSGQLRRTRTSPNRTRPAAPPLSSVCPFARVAFSTRGDYVVRKKNPGNLGPSYGVQTSPNWRSPRAAAAGAADGQRPRCGVANLPADQSCSTITRSTDTTALATQVELLAASAKESCATQKPRHPRQRRRDAAGRADELREARNARRKTPRDPPKRSVGRPRVPKQSRAG